MGNRQSNIELLRIISMVMIIGHHMMFYCNSFFNSSALKELLMGWYYIWGGIGINVFILISGYFMCTNSKLSINIIRLIKIWGEVFFYSMLVFILGVNLGLTDFSTLYESFLPISNSVFWFVSVYMLVVFLSPLINHVINNIPQKALQMYLVLFTFLWIIIPSFLFHSYYLNELLWFIHVYTFGGYIRKYGLRISRRKNITVLSVCLFIATALFYIFTRLSITNDQLSHLPHFSGEMNNILNFIISVNIFVLFSRLNIKTNKYINFVSSSVFGIYMAHENIITRAYMWPFIFGILERTTNYMYILIVVLIPPVIFVAFLIADILRRGTLGYLFNYLIDSNKTIIQKRINSGFKKIVNFIFR